MITTQQDQARHLAALEAAFVAEISGLRATALVAQSALKPASLEPHVESWIADWAAYHRARSNNSVCAAALDVALDHLSVPRIAAAVWTQHRQTPIDQPKARIVVSPGSSYGRQEAIIDGQSTAIPGSVAAIMRAIAAGESEVRIRKEAWRELCRLSPWLAEHLEHDRARKEVARKALYRIKPQARAFVACT